MITYFRHCCRCFRFSRRLRLRFDFSLPLLISLRFDAASFELLMPPLCARALTPYALRAALCACRLYAMRAMSLRALLRARKPLLRCCR